MQKCMKRGALPGPYGPVLYGDVSNVEDYQTSKNKVIAADKAFKKLPAAVRSRFKNDPAELFAFLDNASNLEEAKKLGLIEIPQPDEIPDSPVSNPENPPA